MTVHCSLLALRGIAQHCIKKIILYSESCILHYSPKVKIQDSVGIFNPLT